MNLKFLKLLLLSAFILFIFSISFSSNNDFSQDLGRHLAIGKIIVQTKKVPKANLFSYTNAQFPFINHHWLSEVVFFELVNQWGMQSLQILKLTLIGICFFFLFKKANKKNGFVPTFFSFILILPLLIDRLRIRPELFGYVFFSLFLILLLSEEKKNWSYIIFPVIMGLWVNLHITFIFGLFLVGVEVLFLILKKKKYKTALVLLISVITSILINPNGIRGALYPFTIFGNYGYMIVENQNIFYLRSMITNPFFDYFLYILPIFFIAGCILIFKKKWKEGIILIVFTLLPMIQWRHLPFFILSGLFILPVAMRIIWQKLRNNIPDEMISLASILLFIGLIISSFLFVGNETKRKRSG